MVLGYIQRGGLPTARDRLLASRMGAGAVKAIVDGHASSLVGELRGEISFFRCPKSRQITHARYRLARAGRDPLAIARAPAVAYLPPLSRTSNLVLRIGNLFSPWPFIRTGGLRVIGAGRRNSKAGDFSANFQRGASAMTEYRAAPDVIMENLVGLHQILPSQYFDVSGGHRLTAEQRLMLALLADAINVYQQGAVSRATRKRLLYIDAERWIMMAAQPGPHAFSFDTGMRCARNQLLGAAPPPDLVEASGLPRRRKPAAPASTPEDYPSRAPQPSPPSRTTFIPRQLANE